MTRWYAVALTTLALVAVLTPPNGLHAQGPGRTVPANAPINFSGGAPGLNIELYINNGKVADLTVNQQGTANGFLDFSNLGKAEVRVYVDECQDGKTVKVMVTPGQAAEDNGCKRRIAGGAFWTDCGKLKLTIDLRKFGLHVVNCGNFFTSTPGLATEGGVGAVALLTLLSGGSDTPVFASTPAPSTGSPATGTTPTNTGAPSSGTPSSGTPGSGTPTTGTPTTGTPTTGTPTTGTPATPPPVSLGTVVICVAHSTGFSTLRITFISNQNNTGFTVTTSGPAVQQPTVSGTTNASGAGSANVNIGLFGSYSSIVSMIVGGTTYSATGNITVTSQGTC